MSTASQTPFSRIFLSRLGGATPAHVVPFLVFMVFISIPGFFLIDNTEREWYRHAPEQWVYPIQTVICLLLLAWYWRYYPKSPVRGLVLGSVMGVIGIACWLLPSKLYYVWDVASWDQIKSIEIPFLLSGDTIVWEYLGLGERLEGFDPSFFADESFWYPAAVLMRFVRMVVVVPLVEEIFWRSWLMRYIIDPDKWQKVKFGTHSWKAFFVSTIAFTLVHAPIDYFACLIYGSLTYWVTVKTKSLWAPVIMHAVANLLLGIYTVQTQQWGFW
jgi:uncharacterized protein